MQLAHHPLFLPVPSLSGTPQQRVTHVHPPALSWPFCTAREAGWKCLEACHAHILSPRMPVVLQVQLTLACLAFCVAVCATLREGVYRLLGCSWAALAQDLPSSPSHVCGTSLQCSRQSMSLSPSGLCSTHQDLSLLTVLGLAIATSTISTGRPRPPRLKASQAVVSKPHRT